MINNFDVTLIALLLTNARLQGYSLNTYYPMIKQEITNSYITNVTVYLWNNTQSKSDNSVHITAGNHIGQGTLVTFYFNVSNTHDICTAGFNHIFNNNYGLCVRHILDVWTDILINKMALYSIVIFLSSMGRLFARKYQTKIEYLLECLCLQKWVTTDWIDSIGAFGIYGSILTNLGLFSVKKGREYSEKQKVLSLRAFMCVWLYRSFLFFFVVFLS